MDTTNASGDGSGGRLRPQAGALMADGVFHGGGGALRRWTMSGRARMASSTVVAGSATAVGGSRRGPPPQQQIRWRREHERRDRRLPHLIRR
ncbi:hypothetical protein ACLOJK_041723 [Asimina triloba]